MGEAAAAQVWRDASARRLAQATTGTLPSSPVPATSWLGLSVWSDMCGRRLEKRVSCTPANDKGPCLADPAVWRPAAAGIPPFPPRSPAPSSLLPRGCALEEGQRRAAAEAPGEQTTMPRYGQRRTCPRRGRGAGSCVGWSGTTGPPSAGRSHEQDAQRRARRAQRLQDFCRTARRPAWTGVCLPARLSAGARSRLLSWRAKPMGASCP